MLKSLLVIFLRVFFPLCIIAALATLYLAHKNGVKSLDSGQILEVTLTALKYVFLSASIVTVLAAINILVGKFSNKSK